MKEEGKIDPDDDRGYKYNKDGVSMVEFHVDDYSFLHDVAEERGYQFGGTVSVRKPEGVKPLIVFGQDEVVFSQYLMGTRQWVGPNGERALLPKSDGASMMISAFQSRDLGFGIEISDALLEEINNSFVIFFELRAANEGYWTYNHMATQFEVCIDCLKVMHPDCNFAFTFDHSQGHAKKQKQGLDASQMNAGYGGMQPIMRSTVIKERDGYLGQFVHDKMLRPGDTQHFIFRPPDLSTNFASDEGPFWMSDAKREATRHDYKTGVDTRDKRVAELRKDLMEKGVIQADDKNKYRHARLQEMAEQNGIDLKITVPKIEQGWEGKPVGLKHALWERGWIDAENLNEYTMVPKMDDNGELLNDAENYSLLFLMSSCLDFAEEETQLQHVGTTLDILVFITPKFHAKIAGEGIAYSWGILKGVYRCKPLQEKKQSREVFRELVKTCVNRNVLTTKLVRKLSRRARAYICAYYSIKCLKQDDNNNAPDKKMTLSLIESQMKEFKSHRLAINFDAGFLNAQIKQIEG